MKVYGHPFSTCTRKVLATFAEKGVKPELINVDLGKGEHKSAEHLARQPFGVIPVLEDNGFQLYESRAIIRYLNDRLEGPSLVPADLKARGRMEQFISVEQSYFTPQAMTIIYQLVFGPMRGQPVDPAVVAKGRAGTDKALDVLEKTLAHQPYLAGDEFTLAEICYMPYLEYVAGTSEKSVITDREHVSAWWERISSRPSWKTATGKA